MKVILSLVICSLISLPLITQAETCSAKMKKIVARKDSPTYLSGDVSISGFTFDVSILAAIPLRIRAKNANKALAVLNDAAKGGGPATKKLWDRLNGKHKKYSQKITYQQFVKAIHSADLKGTSCFDDEVMKKKDFKEIALDEQDSCDKTGKNKQTESMKKFSNEVIQKLQK